MNTTVQKTPSTDRDHSGDRILIVDDEATNIQVLQNYLSIENYQTEFATNGLDAIKRIETESFDLVLLDIMMPRMSGYEVCRAVKEAITNARLANTDELSDTTAGS